MNYEATKKQNINLTFEEVHAIVCDHILEAEGIEIPDDESVSFRFTPGGDIYISWEEKL